MPDKSDAKSWPPFFGGPGRAKIMAALGLHVHLTIPELKTVLGWKSPRTLYRFARELSDMRLIVGHTWSYRDANLLKHRALRHNAQEKLWTLDRSHPWIWEIRAFCRALAKAMRLPGPSAIGRKKKRNYIGPGPNFGRSKAKSPTTTRRPPKRAFPVCGREAMTSVLMLLGRQARGAEGVAMREMAVLLGLNRYGVQRAVDRLESWGILRSTWIGTRRLVALNPKYAAQNSLKALLVKIDEGTGGTYRALMRIRKSRVISRKIRALRARRYWPGQ